MSNHVHIRTWVHIVKAFASSFLVLSFSFLWFFPLSSIPLPPPHLLLPWHPTSFLVIMTWLRSWGRQLGLVLLLLRLGLQWRVDAIKSSQCTLLCALLHFVIFLIDNIKPHNSEYHEILLKYCELVNHLETLFSKQGIVTCLL